MKKHVFLISLLTILLPLFSIAQMSVKDSDANLLMQVNDEGTMGSITLSDTSVALDSENNKLYSRNDTLIWNGQALGAGSGGSSSCGWTDDGAVVRLSTSTDKVGLGTSSPNEQLELTGNLRLPVTTSTAGIIKMGDSLFIHSYSIQNLFMGKNAGNLTMSGLLGYGHNTGIGNNCLNALTSGYNNTATGYNSLKTNTTGRQNTAMGSNALQTNLSGSDNVAVGYRALLNNSTGSLNVAIGSGALYENTNYSYNIAIGGYALYDISGQYNIGIGYNALRNTERHGDIALGSWALQDNTTGSGNIAIGGQALQKNLTGYGNIGIGAMANYKSTDADCNIAIGYQTLLNNTSGSNNTVIGYYANPYNETGSSNTIIGYRSGTGVYPNNYSGNIFIGYQAGYNETGSNKLYIENSNSATPLIGGDFAADEIYLNGMVQLNGFKMSTGASDGYVLTSDASGTGTWQSLAAISTDGDWTIAGSDMYSAVTGNVGIGDTSPSAKLDVLETGSNSAGYFQVDNSTSGVAALHVTTNSETFGPAIYADNSYFNTYARIGYWYGVYGHGWSTRTGVYGSSTDGRGVYGISSTGVGVYGDGQSNYGVQGITFHSSGYAGVYGRHNSNSNYGYLGDGSYGAYGYNNSGNTYGYLGGSSYGAYGRHNTSSNYGYLGASSYGVYGYAASGYGVYGGSNSNIAVYGSSNTSIGVRGASNAFYGVQGTSSSQYGVYGITYNANGYAGVYGKHNTRQNVGTLGDYSMGVYGLGVNGNAGVYGYSASGNAVFGSTSTGKAGYFSGDVDVTGTLTKGGGSFKIDHPLDPENKYLSHSFVESPDMMNVYNGNVVLNSRGEAVVELPDWFEALNKEFRYQLTCIGGFAQIYIAEEISSNRFKIAGGSSGLKVSWQVTGIRQDAFANANRIVVEEYKQGDEQGTYLYPEANNMPKSMGVNFEQEKQMETIRQENESMQQTMETDNHQQDESERLMLEQEEEQRRYEHEQAHQEAIRMDEERAREEEMLRN